MRLSMMPTTKKKLGGIGLFMRQADGSLGGPGSSPRAGVVGLPTTPAAALSGSSHATQLPQLQPPPEIVTARQSTQSDTPATARSIPAPKAGRYAAPPQLTATMSLPAQHYHPMQRTRTSASDTTRDPPRGHNAWEDSTVASMFGDNESRAASERPRAHPGNHARHYSDAAHQRTHQSQPSRAQPKHDENLPFVIGENGILKVITAPSGQMAPHTAPVHVNGNGNGNGGIFDDQSVKTDDAFQDARQLYETPTRSSGLRRTKLPYRDTRDVKSNASSDRPAAGYSPDAQSLSMSPERTAEAGEHIDKIRIQERIKRDHERQRERERERERERQLELERELQHKRSTVFENLTPVEFDEPFNDTQAAVIAPSSGVDPEALKEALQRTPRASRQPQPQSQPLAPQTRLVADEAPLGWTASRRLKEPSNKDVLSSRKRRPSLDYNDAELHSMSYSDLRGQVFDFDPQAAALQQTTVPAGGTIEERLEHYRTKGSLAQHEFFARLPMDEWDEAGDWFLEQFGGIVQRYKKARKAKRQLVQQFETEIAAREEAVRVKIEGIGRTLEDLKQEGQTMMQGKDMDLDF
ncbi:hypothetical protein MFIFM68171_06926 [Madurella fahalii]|uniref:Extracellular mutant protein 11 C-terminal domain-containing protein n=1 Tax=Madurella fahalii TaxID=1157608 RepID=A0ABQ0GG25_9PEZI